MAMTEVRTETSSQQELAPGAVQGAHWLLVTLEQLLAIDSVDLRASLNKASDLVGQAVNADKVDIFLYATELDALVAMGISDTPLSRREKELGLNILPLAGGGRTVQTFQNKKPFVSGNIEIDPDELIGLKRDLGIRSVGVVPLYVAGELRGALQVDSLKFNAFSEYDLRFLEAVTYWIGAITHRVELVEKIRREAWEEARRATADELITILAHDLGNYLTPIMGRADVLRRRAVRESHKENRQDSEELLGSIRRLDGMVQDLLDTGRLEQGIFAIFPQRLDLVTLVRETVSGLSAPEHPINVAGADVLWIDGDPARLRQALENILSNAIKHSPPATPVQVIVSDKAQEDSKWATITIRDQGPGIHPKLLPQIFRRFAPGPGSRGLGLGLYLAHGITLAHGGILTVDSTPGEGATFSITLPVDAKD